MKQLSIFIILVLVIALYSNSVRSATTNTLANSNIKYTSMANEKNNNNAKSTSSAVFGWEGWIKYFHYDSSLTIRKPNEFFVNNYFYSQRVEKSALNSMDKKGIFNNVTTKYSFYTKMFENTLKILNEKDLHFGKTFETLDIDLIKPLDPTEPLKGSIKDLGTFSEGSCVSILVLKTKTFDSKFLAIRDTNNTKSESWIICFEGKAAKDKFFTTIVTYKLLRQKELNIELALRENPDEKAPITKKIERYQGSDANPEIDGYLSLMQDWTDCNLKCGGGTQTQQWRCVPPKAGGKPCMGEKIRTKKCNEEPCPGISIAKDQGKPEEEETITFKPIFRSMPFIDRPQQDIPCVIREADILYEKFDKKSNFTVQVPGRILINNRTISVYEDSSYDNAVFSHNLKETEMKKYKLDHCCFFIQSGRQSTKICALADCGSKGDPKFLNSWKYSFQIFKNKCFTKTESEILSDQNQEDLRPKEPSALMASMNIENTEVEEREKMIEEKVDENVTTNLDKELVKNQQTALKAITREFNLEERLKREEIQKAKEETKVLVKKMKFEEVKQEKLEEALDEREAQDIKLRENKIGEKEAVKVLYTAEDTINKKRLALKKKILEIRKMTQRRKRLIENKISLIRGKMAQEIVTASKSGDINVCKNRLGKKDEILKYCEAELITDFNKHKECKEDESSYCYLCCENTFGTMQYNKRAKCYDTCDKDKADKDAANKPRGDWIWKENSPKN